MTTLSSVSATNIKTLNLTEELERTNKIKYNLSLAYFGALTIMMTTLFI